MNLLTATQAAEKLGVHRSRVHVLIKEGRLPAQRLGRAYMIEEPNLRLVEGRQTGRPSKQKLAEANWQATPTPKRAMKKGKKK
jgi:excisionase family DNA binding protein